MERFIHNENLKLYRQKLANPSTDESERETIKKLLAEEEAKDISPPPLLSPSAAREEQP
jgi:hypothetical protein